MSLAEGFAGTAFKAVATRRAAGHGWVATASSPMSRSSSRLGTACPCNPVLLRMSRQP